MRYHLGKEGFIWFVGVVEDRNDPEQLGRVRVRCFGWHTEDKVLIPTDALHWATCLVPPNLPATYTPKEADWVFGFFLDSDSAQNPVVVGVLPGKPKEKPDAAVGFSDPNDKYPNRLNEPTTSRLARGREDGTIIETRRRNLKSGVKSAGKVEWSEPEPKFAPEYPFNYAHESESGHAIELDDTEGNERVQIAHRNGSFIEMTADGDRLEKVTKDNYTVIMGNDFVVIEGKCNITVVGDCNLKTSGKLNVEANEINMAASGDVRIKAGGKLKMESGKTTDIKSGGAAKIGSGGDMSIKGAATTVQGNSVKLAGKVANKVKIPPKTDKKGGIGKILPTGSASSPSNTGLDNPS